MKTKPKCGEWMPAETIREHPEYLSTHEEITRILIYIPESDGWASRTVEGRAYLWGKDRPANFLVCNNRVKPSHWMPWPEPPKI